MIASQIALALVLSAAPFSMAAAAGGVPHLKADQMCRDTASAGMDTLFDVNRCIQSEKEARDKLAKEWTDFSAANRTLCTETASMGGSASYVELITCLEMQHNVAMERRDAKLKTKR
jgi:hypothetical protein